MVVIYLPFVNYFLIYYLGIKSNRSCILLNEGGLGK